MIGTILGLATLPGKSRLKQWLNWYNYTVFQRSDAKIQISITTAHLIRVILLAASIIAFLAQTLQISTKSTTWFLSNSFLKNGT